MNSKRYVKKLKIKKSQDPNFTFDLKSKIYEQRKVLRFKYVLLYANGSYKSKVYKKDHKAKLEAEPIYNEVLKPYK